MGIPLERLLASPALGLQRIAGPERCRVEVEWAHVSELVDPTTWIAPGTLLLTTGLQLFTASAPTLEYCRRLVAADVAALGISVGEDLAHGDVPGALIEAADRSGLPLVLVPYRTPLESVVREVAGIQERERSDRLLSAIEAQRALTASAIRPGGFAGPLAEFARVSGSWAIALDRGGTVVASAGEPPEGVLDEIAADVARVRTASVPMGSSVTTGGQTIHLTSIGTPGALRGALVAGKPADEQDPYDRILVTSTVSLLTLEFERHHIADAPRRRALARLLDRLANEAVNPAELDERLARFGLAASDVVALVVEVGEGASADDVLSATQRVAERLAEAGITAIASEHGTTVRVLLLDPSDEGLALLGECVREWHSGVGDHAEPGRAVLSFRQAARARAAAVARDVPLVSLGGLRGNRAILGLAEPTALTAFAEAVLAPLDLAESAMPVPVLVSTLRAYLHAGGHMETAAAEMRVHRHTVRQRIARIEQISGRDLRDPHDRLELWMAVEVRELLGPVEGS